MSNERIDPQFKEAVVTYSRVPAREHDVAEERRPSARREPTLDATEIHVLDGHDDAGLDFGVRSERLGDAAEVAPAALDLDGKRSRVSRIVFTTAALSIVAGVGVLAASVGIATITPSRDSPTAGAPPALAAVDASGDAATESGIREIPLAIGADAATAAVEPGDVAPPLPRARPEEGGVAVVTSSEPAPAPAPEPVSTEAELRPSAEPAKPEVASLPPPAKATPSVPELVPVLPPPVATLPPPAAQVTPVSAPASADAAGNTDALISSIEQTLARRDASGAPLPGASDPHGLAVSPDGQGPVTMLPPPASMSPNYPSPQAVYPSAAAAGPTYDVVPPAPVTGNGYGTPYPSYPAQALPAGPVPPADVPYAYPPEDAYGYPSRPMDYEMIPEKRPGFLRRTLMRTADAVKGVFTRDEPEQNIPY